MTSSVIYNGDLRTTCTHLKSGSSFETDAPVDNNGKGERFSPLIYWLPAWQLV
jgi:hypothetical protein